MRFEKTLLIGITAVVSFLCLLAGRTPAAPLGASKGIIPAAATVAIIEFSGQDTNLCRKISESLAANLSADGAYRIVDIDAVKRATDAMGAKGPDMSAEQLRSLGDKLSARWLIVGSVKIEGDQLLLQAHVADGRTGEPVPNAGASAIGGREASRRLARALAGEIRHKMGLPSGGEASHGRVTAPARTIRTVRPPSAPQETPENCTGLLVDVRNLRLERDASPFIMDEEGVQVYPDPAHIPADTWVVEHGMASYVFEPEDAERSGRQPLRIRAVRVSGPGPFNVVVSHEDATRIRAANQRTGFLNTWNVSFLTDRDKSMHLLGGKAYTKYVAMFNARAKSKSKSHRAGK